MIIDILTIVAIGNLITEQSIVRKPILKLFNYKEYLNFNPVKKFFFDLLSCPPCISVWIAIISLILKQEPIGIQYIYIPMISMLVSYWIHKK